MTAHAPRMSAARAGLGSLDPACERSTTKLLRSFIVSEFTDVYISSHGCLATSPDILILEGMIS